MNALMWIGVGLFGICAAVLGLMIWIAPRLEDDLRERADDETAEQVGPPSIPWRRQHHGRSPAQEARLRASRRLR